MPIPNSDRHGLWVNDGTATQKLIHAAWVNDNGTAKAAKEIWINNDGTTPTRVWPPRAYVVELVPVGTYDGSMGITLVDNTTSTVTTSASNGFANIGNWNAIWGGCQQSGNKQVTFAFRRWDRYDAIGNYDFSLANNVRRPTATGAIVNGQVGQGHGGLWKTLLQTSPYDPNDRTTHSPFVVIEPGSQILCIRIGVSKTYSGGSGEGSTSPVANITFVSGNATYFGSTSTSTHLFGANINDVPSAQTQPIGLIVSAANNNVSSQYGIISARGSRGGFGISTSDTFAATLNNGTWMTSKNYGTTSLSSTIYGYDIVSVNTPNTVLPGTLPQLTTGVGGNTNSIGSNHVGWKYITMDSDDGAGAAGTVYRNFNPQGANFTGNTSLGSTLFLVIPP